MHGAQAGNFALHAIRLHCDLPAASRTAAPAPAQPAGCCNGKVRV